MVEIRAGQFSHNRAFLEKKGLEQTGQDTVCVSARDGSNLERSVTNNDVGLDGALGSVVV
jgi:hypothetical protein